MYEGPHRPNLINSDIMKRLKSSVEGSGTGTLPIGKRKLKEMLQDAANETSLAEHKPHKEISERYVRDFMRENHMNVSNVQGITLHKEPHKTSSLAVKNITTKHRTIEKATEDTVEATDTATDFVPISKLKFQEMLQEAANKTSIDQNKPFHKISPRYTSDFMRQNNLKWSKELGVHVVDPNEET